jgi:hypothetical protein
MIAQPALIVCRDKANLNSWATTWTRAGGGVAAII